MKYRPLRDPSDRARRQVLRRRHESVIRLRELGLGATAATSERPLTRGECRGADRPCPWVSCRHHLYLDAALDNGTLHYVSRGELWDLRETCSLDVADRGPHQLAEIGDLLGLTRERVRQIERTALEKLRACGLFNEEAVANRRSP